ncbi:MAG: hypothetical protein OXG15_07405 [Gammaproteobacteria bacterium]|nr:hypothetical protein [Gammaproteobacteria bacterium]
MSVGIDAIHLSGKIANQVDEVQQRRLGEDVYFPASDSFWTYVRFDTVGQRGEHFRDAVTNDIVGSNPGAVTTAAAVGTNKLTDSGAFANDDVRGAIGQITAGGGVGQIFFVKDNDDDDNVIIELLAELQDLPELDEKGWRVALTTASRYRLRQPGAVRGGHGSANFTRGFVQQDVTSDMIGKYGYVLRSGIGYGRFVLSDTDIPAVGELLVASANGLLEGLGNVDNITNVASVAGAVEVYVERAAQSIAICQHGDLTTTANNEEALIMVEARVPTTIRSYFNPQQMKDPLSYTTLGR